MTVPLTSLKVLDFTSLLPGPFATMVLADLGADVIRVESPTRPDMVRFLPPFDDGVSAWHAALNRNKRSLALDLKRPEAAGIIKRLISAGGYDIVIEQFRPGVMDRLGIGYEILRETNPGLIYCALTGYGQTGPLRDRAGHDINYLALSGVLSYSGRREAGPPPLGIQVADIGGGALGALVGLLAAIVHRSVTGQGQFVDISMFDMMVAWQTHILGQTLLSGEEPAPENMPLNGGSAYDVYETADGRWLSVGALEPKFWAGLCAALERPDLIAAGSTADPAAQAAAKTIVREIIAGRPLAAWIDIFAPLDLCVEPVLTAAETLRHPQTLARDLVITIPKPGGGTQQQIGTPWRFPDNPAAPRQQVAHHSGVEIGAHTAEILSEIGLSPTEFESRPRRGSNHPRQTEG